MRGLPSKLRIYLLSVYFFTVASLIIFIKLGILSLEIPSFTSILTFVIILALTESFTTQYKNLGISASFVVHLTVILLYKPATAIVVLVIGYTFSITKYNDKYIHVLNTPLYKTFYNYCASIITILYSGTLFYISPGNFDINKPWSNIHLIILLCASYFLINLVITSILYSLLDSKSIFYFLKSNIRLGLFSSIAMAPFGVILAYTFNKLKFSGVLSSVLLVILPIVIARYTFSLFIQTKTQYIQTVDTLMRAMEARDKYTEGHSQRVAEIAADIARELKYSDSKIERLNIASLLHDVGKIGIDDSILNKPGKLTFEEYETIKSHPEIGYNILKEIKNLEDILPIIRHHHERYDGKGYPEGKSFEDLSLDVFVVQLADTVDAMATDRPYRKALSEDKIIDEIVTYSGTQFHPKVVEAYLKIVERQKKAV